MEEQIFVHCVALLGWRNHDSIHVNDTESVISVLRIVLIFFSASLNPPEYIYTTII